MASMSALNFARAVVDEGHQLYRVFFYHAGASVANALAIREQDEPNLPQQWLALASEYEVELAVCVAAAQRRGVLSAAEQQRYLMPAASALNGFTIVGLGQMLEAAITADHFVTFPAC